tara:strand:- start:84 stop:677 length:594 start_codon:yes stop_codon:yes gene_type:complete
MLPMATLREGYQIFCDLDGVLVDLYKGTEKEIRKEYDHAMPHEFFVKQMAARDELGNKELSESFLRERNAEFKPSVHNFFHYIMCENRDFWMDLPWTQGGKSLWQAIQPYNPIILSRPTDFDSIIGKKCWVDNNLDIPHERVIIQKNKSEYSSFGNKVGLLIDDYDKNVNDFRQAGGEAILHNDVVDTLYQLKKYGF